MTLHVPLHLNHIQVPCYARRIEALHTQCSVLDYTGFHLAGYLSNRPLFLWVYRRNKPRGMLGEHEESL